MFQGDRERGEERQTSSPLSSKYKYVLIVLLFCSHFLKDNELFVYFTVTYAPCCLKTQHDAVIFIVTSPYSDKQS